MINSNFLHSLQKKIDKLDKETLKKFIYELINENDSIKNVFNSMKEGVLVLDSENRITFYNKMAQKILEISFKNFLGFDLSDILEEEKLLNLIKQAIEKDEKINNLEIFLDFKNPKTISLSLHPLVHSGTIIGNILIIEDEEDIIVVDEPSVGSECVVVGDCGNENDVCSNGYCVTLPEAVEDDGIEEEEEVEEQEEVEAGTSPALILWQPFKKSASCSSAARLYSGAGGRFGL